MKSDSINNHIIMYQSKSGETLIDVKIENDTVWLTQKQMAELFGIDRTVITRHLSNIFKTCELDEKSNVQKMHIANSDKPIKMYDLDAIISVGYRVNSKQATQFRIWATKTLRHYLIDGYVINEKRLLEEKNRFNMLHETINFIERKADNYLLQDKTRELLSLVKEYSSALSFFKQYDDGRIKIRKTTIPTFKLSYEECRRNIDNISIELRAKKEASSLFGQETNNKFKSIIGVIDQTFDSVNLYKSIEEKAANIFYLIIKDHPFSDGNKRIAAILFVYYLEKNNFLYKNYQKKISNNALISLALLIATSDPKDKDLLIKIITSLIQ